MERVKQGSLWIDFRRLFSLFKAKFFHFWDGFVSETPDNLGQMLPQPDSLLFNRFFVYIFVLRLKLILKK